MRLSGILQATVMEPIDLPIFRGKLGIDGLNSRCTVLVLNSLLLKLGKNDWFPDLNTS